MISFASICPHPPIIVPGIGQDTDLKAVKRTVSAMKYLARQLQKVQPDTVVIISPHAPIAPSKFLINTAAPLRGDFYQFRMNASFSYKNNLTLVKKIQDINTNIAVDKHDLDHGTLVPLYYLLEYISPSIIQLSFSLLSLNEHFHYGQLLGKVLQSSKEKIAVIASGDLSHRLIPSAPAGFSPRGKEFDQKLINFFENKNVDKILEMNEDFIIEAGECGLRSFVIFLGILNDQQWNFEKLCYEGPFGVGYLTAKFI